MKKILLFSIIIIFQTLFTFKTFALYSPKSGVNGYVSIVKYENDPLFGEGSKYACGYYDKIKKISEDNYKNSYLELDKYYYEVFKYSKPLEATVSIMDEYFMYLPRNSSGTYTLMSKQSNSSTYEKDLKTTSSTTISSSLSGKVDINKIFSNELKISNNIMRTSEVNVKTSNSYSYEEGYSVTTNIPTYDKDTWWRLEIRSRFNVYKVYTYQIIYDQVKETHKTWYGKKYNSFKYYINSYELCEESYEYSYIDSTCAVGIYKYIPISDGTYKFDGFRFSDYTYLD